MTEKDLTHDAMLDAILNLSRFHREHEKFYATEPRATAVELQRIARTLQALSDRWSGVQPATPTPFSPFEGAEDLNAPQALALDGVLFMEGEGEPAELGRLTRRVRTLAEDSIAAGAWLRAAMDASWGVAAALLDYPQLADLLGDRHQIIANDSQAAEMSALAGRVLARALDVLDRVDFAPAALRADLADHRTSAALVSSAAEMIGHAADLLSDSAGLVHDNERRWRTFRARVAAMTGAGPA
ncbi:MAG: hypothetical protein ACXVK4_07365 [Acidimicrobiia bacterium]